MASRAYYGLVVPESLNWTVRKVMLKSGPNRLVVEKSEPLSPRHDLRNHSPDGFAWGYAGSGPAQLALALLADLYDDEFAMEHYQAFKFAFVAKLPKDEPWSASETALRAITDGLALRNKLERAYQTALEQLTSNTEPEIVLETMSGLLKQINT